MAQQLKHTSKPKGLYSTLLRAQKPMRKVMIATLPCIFGSIYFFGWRSLAVIIVSCAVAFTVEYLFCRRRGEPASEAVFVTGILFALIMPPTVPWHVVVIGAVFAIMFSKEVFGGFGRNFFNPAMAGRCFVYICFPVALTAMWATPAPSVFDGLQEWLAGGFHHGMPKLTHLAGALGQWSVASVPEAITSATPMGQIKLDMLAGKAATVPPLSQLLFGNIGGVMGGTSALLALIGGLYLFVTRTASRTIILSVIIPYMALNQVLAWMQIKPFVGALPSTLGAGFLFGALFMATDPVSAPKTEPARVAYGTIIAVCVVVIRNYSIFPAGFMFSLLIANMFAAILDHAVNEWKKRKGAKPAAQGAAA
ncbi:RnfABCDGE type electron transport complex subunit D [bacterium]|nr:RnfABCDGE type electron transport complex subunit D [bacterium]